MGGRRYKNKRGRRKTGKEKRKDETRQDEAGMEKREGEGAGRGSGPCGMGRKGRNHDEVGVSFLLETRNRRHGLEVIGLENAATQSAWLNKRSRRPASPLLASGRKGNAQGAGDTKGRSRYSLLQPVHKLRWTRDRAGTDGKGRVQ